MRERNANIATNGAGHDSKLMVSYLVGSRVQNHRAEYLGEVKEVILDAHSGRVSYAVLSVASGFLGMDQKLFAVPWDALTFDSKSGSVVLTVEKDRLKQAPGFDKNSWPGTANYSSWWQEMQSHY